MFPPPLCSICITSTNLVYIICIYDIVLTQIATVAIYSIEYYIAFIIPIIIFCLPNVYGAIHIFFFLHKTSNLYVYFFQTQLYNRINFRFYATIQILFKLFTEYVIISLPFFLAPNLTEYSKQRNKVVSCMFAKQKPKLLMNLLIKLFS